MELIKSFGVSKLKIRPHYVLRSGLTSLNLKFGVNRSICGIWRLLRSLGHERVIISFKDFKIQNSGRTITDAAVKLA